MGSILLVEVPPRLVRHIRDRLNEHPIRNISETEAITGALAQATAEDVDAVVLGSRVDARLNLAEQASTSNPDLAVLMLCPRTELKLVAQSLLFSAFVGPDVRPVATPVGDRLATLVAEAVNRTQRRRYHRSVLAGATSTAAGPPATSLSLADEIRSVEERFRLVVECVSDPIVTVGEDGCIRSANAATEIVFGYEARKLLGQPITMLMPESLRAAHTAAFARYLQTRERHIPWTGVRLPGRHSDGSDIPLELSFGEFNFSDATVFTCVFHDLTERERAEGELRRNTERLKESNLMFKRLLREELVEKGTLENLAEIALRLDSALGLEEVLDGIFDACGTLLPYDRMACALLEDGGARTRAVWARSLVPMIQSPVGESLSMAANGLQTLLDSATPRFVNDLQAHLRLHRTSEPLCRLLSDGMRSSLTCPLISMGRPLGFLFISSIRPHAYNDTHVEVLIRIKEQLAVIIERGRLWQQLSDAQQELEAKNEFIAQVFGRYASDAVASEVLSTPKGMATGNETRTVSVLFADLRGFTALCDVLDPRQVVQLLNIHLGVMTDVILRHEGTIDEFMGDGILVVFGAPTPIEDHADRAVACALAMEHAMDIVRKELADSGLPPVKMGIAVHTGTVVAGTIGCEKRAKYGIIGPAVNLTTRIESFTDGGQILCTLDTLRALAHGLDTEEGPMIERKGSGEAVQTYSIVREFPA